MKSFITISLSTSMLFLSTAIAQQPINNYYNSPYPNPYNDVPSLIPSTPSSSVTSLIPLNQTNTVSSIIPSNQTSYTSSLIPSTPNNNMAPLAFPNLPAGANPETTTLQQLYSQPALPTTSNNSYGQSNASYPGQPNVPAFIPIQLPVAPFQTIDPPEHYTPGLLTIKDGQWVVSEFFYDLPPTIGIKVEIVKPKDKYVPINDQLLERQIADIFQDNGISPYSPVVSCQPPLPLYHVLVMAYPWEDRCLAFISFELYEEGRPHRVEENLNGVWQMITWQRQTLVACACDELTQEVERVLQDTTNDFADRFRFYHPQPIRKCFPGQPEARFRRKRASESAAPIELRVEVKKPVVTTTSPAPLSQTKGFVNTGSTFSGGTAGGAGGSAGH